MWEERRRSLDLPKNPHLNISVYFQNDWQIEATASPCESETLPVSTPDPRSCCQDGHGARQRDEENIIVGTSGGGGGAKFLTDGLLEAARMIDGSPCDLEHDAEITHSPNTMVSPSRPQPRAPASAQPSANCFSGWFDFIILCYLEPTLKATASTPGNVDSQDQDPANQTNFIKFLKYKRWCLVA